MKFINSIKQLISPAPKKKRMVIHVVPVGGNEPLHTVSCECFCNPLYFEGMVTHHSKDKREQFERQGHIVEGQHWILVNELRK